MPISAPVGAALIGVGGSAISGGMQSRSAKNQASMARQSELEQRAIMEKYGSPIPINLAPADLSQVQMSADPSQQYLLNPSAQVPDYQVTQQDPAIKEAMDANIANMKNVALPYYQTMAREGISQTQRELIQRRAMERAAQAGQIAGQGIQSGQLVGGLPGGGISQQASERANQQIAQQAQQDQFALEMEALNQQRVGIQKLLETGDMIKVGEMQKQLLADEQVAKENKMKETYFNIRQDQIADMNTLTMNLKQIASQQGTNLANIAAGGAKDRIQAEQTRSALYGELGKGFGSMLNTSLKYKLDESLYNYKQNNVTHGFQPAVFDERDRSDKDNYDSYGEFVGY